MVGKRVDVAYYNGALLCCSASTDAASEGDFQTCRLPLKGSDNEPIANGSVESTPIDIGQTVVEQAGNSCHCCNTVGSRRNKRCRSLSDCFESLIGRKFAVADNVGRLVHA